MDKAYSTAPGTHTENNYRMQRKCSKKVKIVYKQDRCIHCWEVHCEVWSTDDALPLNLLHIYTIATQANTIMWECWGGTDDGHEGGVWGGTSPPYGTQGYCPPQKKFDVFFSVIWCMLQCLQKFYASDGDVQSFTLDPLWLRPWALYTSFFTSVVFIVLVRTNLMQRFWSYVMAIYSVRYHRLSMGSSWRWRRNKCRHNACLTAQCVSKNRSGYRPTEWVNGH